MTVGSRSLLIVTMEPPFPPVHGGRVDALNRWRLLAAEGWDLHLATWLLPGDVADTVRAGLAPIFREVYLLPHARGLVGLMKRLLRLPRMPSHLGARDVPADAFHTIVAAARAAGVGAVVSDGLFGAHLARAAARRLSVPLLYRSHNREHAYLSRQARAATRWSTRLRLSLATIGLARYEEGVVAEAAWTFDISADDLAWWQSRGQMRSSWAPPILPAADDGFDAGVERTHDLVYLGNLHTPNNLEGLRWFLDAVMPILRDRRPGTTVLLAGSKPDPGLVAAVAAQRDIEILADPASASMTRARGRVLINPILTGSGVNVKSVEMLATDKPIVTTRVGVQGLSNNVKATFEVARDAADFAERIGRALDRPMVDPAIRQQARICFGEHAVTDLSARLGALIASPATRGGAS